jgi:amidase
MAIPVASPGWLRPRDGSWACQRPQLWQFGARELAEGIRKRSFSSLEAVQSHLERIEQVNPSLNALTRVLEEEALAAAARVDAGLARDESPGPLGGVPFTVKENLDLAGTATTWGNGGPGGGWARTASVSG